MAKKKRKNGDNVEKININSVNNKKKEHLEELLEMIESQVTQEHIHDVAASMDRILNDKESSEILEQVRDDFSEEKLGSLIDNIINKVKEDNQKEKLSIKEVEELLEKSVSVEYIKKMINKRIEQLLSGEKEEEKLSEVERLKRKCDEYLQMARNTQADFDNFRKRTIRENENFRKLATVSLIEKLLPVIDSLENAIEKDGDMGEKALEGFKKIRKQLNNILIKEGLEPIESLGEPFDPEFHEAMFQEESDDVDVETVVEELRKGYKIGDRIVRAPMVKVAIPTTVRNEEESEEENGNREK